MPTVQNYTGIEYRKRLVSGPAAEPVSLEEAKVWLYVYDTEHDTLISNLIKSCRQDIERTYDVALISQTWDLYLDRFPIYDRDLNEELAIQPVIHPVQSITSIEYTDEDGATQTWAAENYILDKPDYMPARIIPNYNIQFPGVKDVQNSIKIRLVAGYGDTSAAVPEPIRTAIMMQVKYLYDMPTDGPMNREPWNRSASRLLRNALGWRG